MFHCNMLQPYVRCGKDFVASGIVLLCKLKLFQGQSLNARLHSAYKSYMKWCSANKKNTSVLAFSKRTFKMSKTLACSVGMTTGSDLKCICYGIDTWHAMGIWSGTMTFRLRLVAKERTQLLFLAGWKLQWTSLILGLVRNSWIFQTFLGGWLGKAIHGWHAKDSSNTLFQLLRYTVRCSNAAYRLLHWRGLWLNPMDNTYAGTAFQEMTDT